jgi:hypothetical protein
MRTNWLAVAAVIAVAAPAAAQVYTPIPVTGFTQDVIADAGGTALATTTTQFDAGPNETQNWVLYQQGYNTAFPTLGIPASGSIVTSPSRLYQLGPINGNNSLQLINPNPLEGGPTVLSGTLSLTIPTRYAALSLLLADGQGRQPSNGGFPGTLAVNWSDGNTTDYAYVVYDWFLLSGTPGPNSGVATSGLDRATRRTGAPDNNMTNPVLFYYDIDLSADSNYLAGALIDSVTAIRQPGFQASDVTNVMGLSGATSVPEPSTLALCGAAAGLALWLRPSRTYGRREQGKTPNSLAGLAGVVGWFAWKLLAPVAQLDRAPAF